MRLRLSGLRRDPIISTVEKPCHPGGLEDVVAKQPITFNGMLPLSERVETAISKARKAAIVMNRLGNISGWQQ